MTDTQRILILGLAREGSSLARHFAGLGHDVTVTDAAPAERLDSRLHELAPYPIRFALGGDHPELVQPADRFFVSPGVPESNPVYVAAQSAGLPIESMTTLFFGMCPGRIVGVTGSSGKTTTTGLIGHILQAAGRDAVVGGNIGEPMLDLLPRIGPDTLVVLELSSFQLAILQRSPHIAVVTNISPNHLDRHGTMAAYTAAKRRIVEYQQEGDAAVLNCADPEVAGFAAAGPAAVHWFGLKGVSGPGATVRDGQAGLVVHNEFDPVIAVEEVPLLGGHNVENVLAALATTALLDVGPEVMAPAVRTFRPAPHRLQTVGERDGVRFVDDSIATSPARAVVALESMTSPVLLIAGGRDKHLPWEEFAALVVQKTRALFLIGEAAPMIEDAVRRELSHNDGPLKPEGIVCCPSLEAAVDAATSAASPGDVVLLSPGCTSYDMFRDFEERGAAFARAVGAVYAA